MLYDNYKELEEIKDIIEEAITTLINSYNNNGKILVCGNGGSSSDSAHITGELMKDFMFKRGAHKDLKEKLMAFDDGEYIYSMLEKAVPCIDLTSESAIISAYSNDKDPSLVYAQLVYGYSYNSKFDVLIAISTSGNSKNIVNAVKVAKAIGLKVISLTGMNDSKLSELSDITIKAPAKETYRIQEYHLPIYHYICQELEKRLFKD